MQIADVQQIWFRDAGRKLIRLHGRRARRPASTPSGATVILDAGIRYAAVISAAENVESVITCAAERALRR